VKPLTKVDAEAHGRSFWLQQALADAPPEAATLRGEHSADVCIVGGGYTGLWTAIAIKQQQPETDVVLIEGDICGAGASGRNSGFLMSWWSKFASFERLFGTDAALRACRASARAVEDVASFAAAHGIDIHFRRDGWLWAASNASQMGSWETTLKAVEHLGDAPFVRLSREEVADISGTPALLGGVLEPGVATIQPALLARGLCRVAVEMGVRVFEKTPLTRLYRATPPVAATREGRVTARVVVLAMNAWAARFRELRRRVVVVSTDAVATAPIPQRLEEIGLTNGLAVTDARRLVNACHTTLDGRLAFSRGGGGLKFAGRLGDQLDGRSRRLEEIQLQFARMYPMLSNVSFEYDWVGPIDYAANGLPYFGPLSARQDILAGIGYSGNGIGPAYLGGRLLASQALGIPDSELECLSRTPAGGLPPEPFRYLGGRVVRHAIASKEAAEDGGRRPSWITRKLAALDPTSFVDKH
jgi:glycine/D-amino acid oxidase-like deaminating enzyme